MVGKSGIWELGWSLQSLPKIPKLNPSRIEDQRPKEFDSQI